MIKVRQVCDPFIVLVLPSCSRCDRDDDAEERQQFVQID